MAAKKTRPRKCPFSNKAPLVVPTADGSCFLQSPYGWRSRLFGSEQEAIDWSHAHLKPLPSEIVPTANGRRFKVVGNGWFSELFQTRDGAVFWASHRAGRPMKSAEVPVPVSVRPTVLDPDDPMADFADMKEEAAEFRAFNEEAVAKAREKMKK